MGNLIDVIKDISYFLNFSPIWAKHLQIFIKKIEKGRTNCKLIDVCRTRWIRRIDGLDVFEKNFTYVIETLEYFSVHPDSTTNRVTISLLQTILIHSINWYCFKWIEKEIWRKPEMHFWRFVYNSIFFEWLIKKPY